MEILHPSSSSARAQAFLALAQASVTGDLLHGRCPRPLPWAQASQERIGPGHALWEQFQSWLTLCDLRAVLREVPGDSDRESQTYLLFQPLGTGH